MLPHTAEPAYAEGQLVLVQTLNGGDRSVLELYRLNAHSFVDMLHARNLHGGSFTLTTADITPIDATTPLTHAQALDLAAFMSRRAVKPEQEEPPAALLTAEERAALDRAYSVLRNGSEKFQGWYPAPPHLTEALKALLERGYLQSERRVLWGRTEELCLHITRDGCRALGRLWVEFPDAAKPVTEDAAPALYPIGAAVYHTRIERVGRVRGAWRASTRTANGSEEVDYVQVDVLGARVTADGVSWNQTDVRAATAEEVAFWTKSVPEGREDEQSSEGAPPQGVDADEPGGADDRALDAGAGRAPGAAADAAPAIFSEWAVANPPAAGLNALLRALVTYADGNTRTRINDLLMLTEEDVQQLIEVAPVGERFGWNEWLTTSSGLIADLIGTAILKPLHDYTEHLRALGREIDDEIRG